MAIHEELIQRMRTVAEIETIDTSDIQQEVQSMFTFLPGRHDVKLGRLEELQVWIFKKWFFVMKSCHRRDDTSGGQQTETTVLCWILPCPIWNSQKINRPHVWKFSDIIWFSRKKWFGQIYNTKSNGPLSNFGKNFICLPLWYFVIYHTWYDFPNFYILPLMILSFWPH